LALETSLASAVKSVAKRDLIDYWLYLRKDETGPGEEAPGEVHEVLNPEDPGRRINREPSRKLDGQ